MKSILLINFFFVSFYNHSNMCSCEKKYSIKIWDYNYSMAYTTLYSISENSVTVEYISGVKNEGDSILMKKNLSEGESKTICDFLSSPHIYRLNDKYSNDLADDGDKKRVSIQINGRTKIFELSNFYQKDMSELFSIVNNIVSKDLKIEYKVFPEGSSM